jgi:hypothetical protein
MLSSSKIMRIILILFFSLTMFAAEARMYQWTEPGVETTQLSGKPPAWYRSVAGGPRVFVFDKGRLIDDTAVEVSDEIRQRMRQEAFMLVEEDRQKAKEKMVKAHELKQKFKKKESKEADEINDDDTNGKDTVVELLTETLFSEENKEDEESKNNMEDKTLEELRAMIADWEKSQTESAKQALE